MSPAIEQLIPHRAPMRWVEELIDCTDTTATATVRFTAEHFAVGKSEPTPFPSQERNPQPSAACNAPLLGGAAVGFPADPQPDSVAQAAPSGQVIETALVECMAQTVAAALGQRLRTSAKPGAANHGLLAAVANFKIHSEPPRDQTLTIEIREVKRLGPMLMIAGKISCGTKLIATGDLSLYA